VRWDGTRWHLWVCRHDVAVPEEADRMYGEYGTSDDGLTWRLHDVALVGRPGRWDQRGKQERNGQPSPHLGREVLPDGRAAAHHRLQEAIEQRRRDKVGQFEYARRRDRAGSR
jgi:hypothetical protein